MNLYISRSKISSSLKLLNDKYNLFKLTLFFTFVNDFHCIIFNEFIIEEFELPQVKIVYCK